MESGHSYYDATPEARAVRQRGLPAIAELAAQLTRTSDPDQRSDLHGRRCAK